MNRTEPRRSSRLARLALLFLGILALTGLAALGEGYARHRERSRDTVPGTFGMLYYKHARLRHALVRDADYFGWIRVNADGFRGAPLAEGADPDRLRILVVGSSTTFDPSVTGEDRTWPRQMEAALRDQGWNVEGVNAGVPGYMFLDNFIRLHTELWKHDPDLVILYEGHNDVFDTFLQRRRPPPAWEPRPDEIRPSGSLRTWLSANSMLYSKLKGRFDVLRFASRPSLTAAETAPLARIRADAGARWSTELSAFIQLARLHDIAVVMPRLVHVSGRAPGAPMPPEEQAMWARAFPFASPDEVMALYATLDETVAAVAAAQRVPVLATADLGLFGTAFYAEGDPIHFNDDGAARMGAGIAARLVESGILAGLRSGAASADTAVLER